MSEKVIKNWIALADYDLKTAEVMFQGGRYVYVAFTCQQAVEKLLKAIYVKEKKQTPPYTHNLIRLAESLSLADKLSSEQKEFLEKLNYFYLESRYSEDLTELSQLCSKQECSQIYEKTKKVFQWLQDLMK